VGLPQGTKGKISEKNNFMMEENPGLGERILKNSLSWVCRKGGTGKKTREINMANCLTINGKPYERVEIGVKEVSSKSRVKKKKKKPRGHLRTRGEKIRRRKQLL